MQEDRDLKGRFKEDHGEYFRFQGLDPYRTLTYGFEEEAEN